MADPGLTPEQDAVRRLLASARHDEPVPEPVVARLEATLAELTADRRPAPADDAPAPAPVEDAPAPVVDLSARRRRRAGAALMAAAAVVVAGVALGQGLGSGEDSMSADTASSEAGAGTEAGGDAEGDGEESPTEDSPDEESGATLTRPKSDADRESDIQAGPEVAPYAAALTSGPGLRAELRGLRDAGLPTRSGFTELAPAEEPACLTTDVGRGRTVWVTYDDSPAIAVFRSPSGNRQVAEVWLCGAASPVRSLSLRAP